MKLTLEHKLQHETAIIADVFYLSENQENPGAGDLPVDFEPVFGTPYFLVYAIHGGGDSFNPTKPQFVELIDMFQDASLASSLVKCVAEHYRGYKDRQHDRTGKLEPWTWEEERQLTFNDKVYHIPWNGYFEELYEVELKVVFFAGNKISLF